MMQMGGWRKGNVAALPVLSQFYDAARWMDALAVPWRHNDTTGVVLQNTGLSRESTELEAKIRTNEFGWTYDENSVGDIEVAAAVARALV